ncbi:MAG: type II secretion system F family protein [Gammaproteobacteria bacterium]|nr:type II secretion system F family protein [Gammaproteobacteria bacterium]
MADLLGSGLSLPASIEATIYKTKNFLYKLMLYQLYHDLFSGASFSDSARKNQLFTQTQSATIQCAEKNQSLREAFLGIHEYLYYQRSRRSKQSIFIYPCVFMIIMTVSFSYYVANNVLNIYMFDLWLQGKKLSFFFFAVYVVVLRLVCSSNRIYFNRYFWIKAIILWCFFN